MAESKTLTKILIIDDDSANLEALAKIVEREGFAATCAKSGSEGMRLFQTDGIRLVITDLLMAEIDGFEVLKRVKQQRPEVEVIVITAHGTIEKAVTAIKQGAYDFITKPFDRISIIKLIHKALEKQQLLKENFLLREELEIFRSQNSIIGKSGAIQAVQKTIEQAAVSDATVLVLGESGTGKELAARALHRQGRRSTKPFIKISCTTLPENLLEAELFGFERGAFTGAVARKKGRFEIADGGTLFLDEIGDLPMALQGKLLRVLQEGAFERLGSNKTIKVDVRIIAATNRDLAEEVEQGRFREDLYYRLNVVQVRLPPLRQRKEDIPLLAEHFLKLYSVRNNKSLRGLEAKAIDRLEACAWPGNVRQLEHAIERAVVFATTELLREDDLPDLGDDSRRDLESAADVLQIPVGTKMKEIEQQVIRETLRRTSGDKVKAANLLGIASRTIYRKLQDG